jgi:hypothetical protein
VSCFQPGGLARLFKTTATHFFLLRACPAFSQFSWRALHLNGFGHRFWRALHLNRLMGGIPPNPDNVACSIHHRGLQCSLWFKWMVLFITLDFKVL